MAWVWEEFALPCLSLESPQHLNAAVPVPNNDYLSRPTGMLSQKPGFEPNVPSTPWKGCHFCTLHVSHLGLINVSSSCKSIWPHPASYTDACYRHWLASNIHVADNSHAKACSHVLLGHQWDMKAKYRMEWLFPCTSAGFLQSHTDMCIHGG